MTKRFGVALVAAVTAVAGVSFLGFSSAALADPAAASGSLPLPTYAQASVSPDWVKTPSGLAYKSCVHEVPDGAVVDATTDTVTLDGVVVAKYGKCPYKGTIKNPDSTQATQPVQSLAQTMSSGMNAVQPPAVNGTTWFLASWYNSPYEVTTLSAQWLVPKNPTQNGALVYLFPSVEPTALNGIVQPVLQWGNNNYFGGNYWSIADWFVQGGASYYSNVQTTSAGHKLLGTISRSSGSATSWSIQVADLTSGGSQGLTLNTGITSWKAVQGGVLEVGNNITSCHQLPTSSGQFSSISLTTTAGKITPGWGARKLSSSCSGNVTTSPTTTSLTWNYNGAL
jgi:hypothetical protein